MLSINLSEVPSEKDVSCVHSQDLFVFDVSNPYNLAGYSDFNFSFLYEPSVDFSVVICDPSKPYSCSSCFGYKREPHFPIEALFRKMYMTDFSICLIKSSCCSCFKIQKICLLIILISSSYFKHVKSDSR